jgi:hypothetical protein
MGTVPQAYFGFIMDYAPYFYHIPGTGVDTEWGRGPAPAAHAIDFLAEAYQSSQFEDEKTGIYTKIVAFNIQKIAREEGRAVFAATTHTDLFEDLKPSVHIHKRFGREIEVNYYPNNVNRECSIVKEMRIEKGTRADYKQLAHFHYRDSRLFVYHKIFTMKRNDETVGAIVYASPPLP